MSAEPTFAATAEHNASALNRYYRWHARLYDATRWSFLFGRGALVRAIAARPEPPRNILEVGCGTGENLVRLARQFPTAAVTGLDLSPDMLLRARRKLEQRQFAVTLLQQAYDHPLYPEPVFDLIVFSYCLTMINPGWQTVLQCALQDLRPDGRLAVVDFHDSRFPAFRRWMGVNHVRMDGHLRPWLNAHCQPLQQSVGSAYGGVWQYFSFIGQKLDGH
ncbi:MAG TPA: class I SAM-dependent methyltransferase [Candidatus Competibacteraceae bacterium]|nr:MAG: class I SAM-dependent methyltransferase [Candidatus Competibacteraceae bacterium]HOB63178.1 class I SAM-dependent methyltransferase [Candidatus Competibacteraceae bacterium]HQA24965.1 class I SAM-dependent methyltransferase [Candidatus Competibacteraceae bacterium]HQD57472.1 class I SAM-dependent methyltransferase [Candidatus Competibacteraceae bacterium]